MGTDPVSRQPYAGAVGRTWRIGEVAERTGLTPRTLRHYEELGLLVPSARSSGDYRLYDEADLLRLLQVQSLKALGLGLSQIAEALRDPGLDASATLRSHLAHLEQQLEAGRRLADRLRTLAGAAERSWDDVLATIALVRQLAHPDPVVRLRAAFRAPGSTAEQLDALAAEVDPAVQEVLVWALARQPDAVEAALERLGTATGELRVRLVRLLGKLRDPAATPALLELLDDPAAAPAAVQALGQAADPAAAPALVAVLGTSLVPDADLVDAIDALGEAALTPLVAALESSSAAARALAAEALGRLGGSVGTGAGTEPATLLAGLLDDPDGGVRLAAVLGLGELGPGGREGLERALRDPTLAPAARHLLQA